MAALEKQISLHVWHNCAPAIIEAARCLEAECTLSHTTKSRRWSIWSLTRRHIDPTLKAYLARFDATWYADLFGAGGFSGCAKANPKKTEDRIRSIIIDHNKSIVWNPEIEATFESLLEIILFCRARPSRHGVDESGPALRGQGPSNQRAFNDEHYPYCELCWRLAMAAEAEKAQNPCRPISSGPSNSQAGMGLSRRFCSIHDPHNPKSKYRADHNYRETFHTKLRAIYAERKANWDFWTRKLGVMHEDEMRKFAYEYVHARPSENRLKAVRLAGEGMNQTEISRHLGISRQAVSKLLRKIPSYFGGSIASNFPTKSSARK